MDFMKSYVEIVNILKVEFCRILSKYWIGNW